MTGVSPGSVTIGAQFPTLEAWSGTLCPPQTCPTWTPSASAGETIDSLVYTITSGGAPNDSLGVVAKVLFNLRIQAKSPSGTVPDPNFNSGGLPFYLTNMNTSVGESAPSTASFSSGTANAGVTAVQASSFTSSVRTIEV